MIKLNKIPTTPPEGTNKKSIVKETKKIAKRIGELQQLMFAGSEHSMLIVFQGMDSSGKDGATRETFKYCSPGGVHAVGFKKPSKLEFAHDFLWRAHDKAPEKGMIKVFNRSHYEDILIQRVHGWIDEERVAKRMAAINAFEELLQFDNNTTVLKFYLHISPERQLEKLTERMNVERKFWKHNDGDWKEREHWDKYMDCYEYALNNSTIPWVVVPVDSRWYRNYFIAKTVLETLEGLNMKFPPLETEMK